MAMLSENVFERALQQYQEGVWRDRILHDLILEDARTFDQEPTFLDIGCGKGFDTDIPLQESLATFSGQYIGVEPDVEVTPGRHVTKLHRCLFEDTDLPANSVHVAFSVMVLEHVLQPEPFWSKLHKVLVDGGIFWAMTVDARHWFGKISMWMETLQCKDWYLSRIMGERGNGRYENYPTHYRCNTPEDVKRYARQFSSIQCRSFSRPGQLDKVLPRFLRTLYHPWENSEINRGKPGTLLLIRAVK
ncbi:MAG: class I SAM-dependent methyltransferase [Gemmataceae bacterium]